MILKIFGYLRVQVVMFSMLNVMHLTQIIKHTSELQILNVPITFSISYVTRLFPSKKKKLTSDD